MLQHQLHNQNRLLEQQVQERTAELRASNERFNRLVSQLNDVVWSASKDGYHILIVNDSFESVYRRPTGELLSSPNLWIETVHPEDQKIAEESTGALLKTGEAKAEYRIVRPDGTIRWILDRKTSLFDEKGVPIIMGVATDITKCRRSEQEVTRQLHRLRALREIDLAIIGSTDMYLSLQIVLEHVLTQLSIDAADILLLNHHTQALRFGALTGSQSTLTQIGGFFYTPSRVRQLFQLITIICLTDCNVPIWICCWLTIPLLKAGHMPSTCATKKPKVIPYALQN